MSSNCMNCGAMLMNGATVCPVCRQPVAPVQRDVNWQQQPPLPPGASWQQPGGQPPFGPPPLGGGSSTGLNAIWLIVIVSALLLVIGLSVSAFLLLKSQRAAVRDENDNYNRSVRVNPTPSVDDTNSTIPPPPPNPRTKTSTRAPISGGVLNGKAISLPKPAYPAIAKSARASGTVTVQVTIDESGKVISAHAVSGHPLLQASAVQAAYGARFSPTLLSGQPVKVTGVLTYNFVLE